MLVKKMVQYWKPSIARSLLDEIHRLFNENATIRKRYANNPVEFLREAVRDKLESFDNTKVKTNQQMM